MDPVAADTIASNANVMLRILRGDVDVLLKETDIAKDMGWLNTAAQAPMGRQLLGELVKALRGANLSAARGATRAQQIMMYRHLAPTILYQVFLMIYGKEGEGKEAENELYATKTIKVAADPALLYKGDPDAAPPVELLPRYAAYAVQAMRAGVQDPQFKPQDVLRHVSDLVEKLGTSAATDPEDEAVEADNAAAAAEAARDMEAYPSEY